MKKLSLYERAICHFRTITKHKLTVMKGCFEVGLYKQGLLHDLSKYSPREFMVGVHYYQGTRSPNAAERDDIGYSNAWLHHKGRNRHHYEYYIDFMPMNGEKPLNIAPMPDKYIVEMFIDRVAACKVYHGDKFSVRDPYDYYSKGNTAQFLHPYTERMLVRLLKMYAKYGEAYTYKYIRTVILKNESGIKGFIGSIMKHFNIHTGPKGK